MEQVSVDVLLGEAIDGHAELVEASIREAGVVPAVHRTRTGPETLAFLRRARDDGRWRDGSELLIFLAARLPRMDGVEVLQALKEEDHLPVLSHAVSEVRFSQS